jgi:hypothetical protein
MGLNTKAFAFTCGILWGATVMLATWWLLIFGFEGQLMRMLDHFYFGYSVSWGGGVVGGIWGLVDGLIGGFVFAWLYNKFAGAQ